MPRYGSPVLFENPHEDRPRLRREPTNRYPGVREVKGGAWQARVWIGGVGSLNLGLHTLAENGERRDWAEQAAALVSRTFLRLWCWPGRTVADVVSEMKGFALVLTGGVRPVRPGERAMVPAGLVVPVRFRRAVVPREDLRDRLARLARVRKARAERERERRRLGRYPAGGLLSVLAA